MPRPSIVQAGAGVHLVTGTNVNWVLVTEGRDVLVVDAGYPRDRPALAASVEAIGHRLGDVVAVLLTHAHLDHIGAAPYLAAELEVPVTTSPQEAAHARREHLEQITPLQMLGTLRRPGGPRWVSQTLRAIGPHLRTHLAEVATVAPGEPLDLPGRPVPVPTPGHTSGHSAYLLPDEGTLLSGDALVSDHPLSASPGAQLLPEVFDHDPAGALQALTALEDLPADVLAPGHGPLLNTPVRELVARARERADARWRR